jgi:hypothetical protein
MPLARLLAMPPVRAELAKVDAWLKRSQRENATVLVIVKMSAIAISSLSDIEIPGGPSQGIELTD